MTHNDLAKPLNWWTTVDGRAALIDTQLVTIFTRRSRLFTMMAHGDLRHLLEQKRSFRKAALTPAEKRLLATKSLPARIWMKTFKPIYNLVTRGVFNWSGRTDCGSHRCTNTTLQKSLQTARRDENRCIPESRPRLRPSGSGPA